MIHTIAARLRRRTKTIIEHKPNHHLQAPLVQPSPTNKPPLFETEKSRPTNTKTHNCIPFLQLWNRNRKDQKEVIVEIVIDREFRFLFSALWDFYNSVLWSKYKPCFDWKKKRKCRMIWDVIWGFPNFKLIMYIVLILVPIWLMPKLTLTFILGV